MSQPTEFTTSDARRIGEEIGVDWNVIPIEQFRKGLTIEMEHGAKDPETNVTDDDEILTGKIALAHLKEFADYYDRLEEMEKAAKASLSGGDS